MIWRELALHWGPQKREWEAFLGLSSDSLHIVAGVVIYLLLSLFARCGLGTIWPWFALLAIEFGNEWIDLNQPGGSPERNLMASWHDVKNTMLLPLLILIAARISCARWAAGHSQAAPEDQAEAIIP
jgi:hypothetical protein